MSAQQTKDIAARFHKAMDVAANQYRREHACLVDTLVAVTIEANPTMIDAILEAFPHASWGGTNFVDNNHFFDNQIAFEFERSRYFPYVGTRNGRPLK